MKIRLILDFIKSLLPSNLIVLLFGLVINARAIGFIPSLPSMAEYSVCIFFALYCLIKAKKIDWYFVALWGFIIVQLLICNPPAIFNVWMRFGLFVVMTIGISPVLQGEYIQNIRFQLWKFTLLICVILSLGSFVCFFLGINFMKRGDFEGIIDVGLFGGLVSHSMLLGSIAAFSSVFLAYKAYKNKSAVLSLLTFASLCVVLFAASRSALISAIAGLTYMLYSISNTKKEFVKVVVMLVLLLCVTFPLWESATDFIVAKQQNNIENGSTFYSRTSKWANRLEEFKSSPMIGIGFGTVSTKTSDYSLYTGGIEPGCSWLSILSMLGIIGALWFIRYVRLIYNGIKSSAMPLSALYMGLFVTCCTHMIAEGYFLSAGGYLFFLVWLSFSVFFDGNFINASNREL